MLSNDDIRIHEAHKTAVSDYHFTYDDPETGLKETFEDFWTDFNV